MSIVFSVIDNEGKVIKANQRENRVIVDDSIQQKYEDIKSYAHRLINVDSEDSI